jgi:hypothetical protein
MNRPLMVKVDVRRRRREPLRRRVRLDRRVATLG